MPFILKQTKPFSNLDTQPMETSTESKPPSKTASYFCEKSIQRVRFLLLRKKTNLWLADNLLIDDKSELYTVNPAEALAFASIDAAAQRARSLMHLFPDLIVEAVEVPVKHG